MADDDSGGGCPLWMVTYGDMMALLLTFFVLIVSFSDVEQSTYVSSVGVMSYAKTGMSIEFKKKELFFTPPVILDTEKYATSTEIPKNVDYSEPPKIHSALVSLSREIQADLISVEMQDKKIVLTIKNPFLFNRGTADLSEAYERLFQKLALVINNTDDKVMVAGYTDSLPIATADYASNWELSLGRAWKVVSCLIKNSRVAPSRFILAGYGDSRAQDTGDLMRDRAENRKVQIIILPKS